MSPMARMLAVVPLLFASVPALAHGGHAEGLLDGLAHPLLGPDHLAAMIAIGLWAALRGGARPTALPTAFLAAMAVGIALGLTVPLPGGVELGVAGSVLVLGVLIALTVPLRAAAALGVAVLAGLMHGVVHGAEIGAAAAVTALGMLAASVTLHAAGYGLGQLAAGQVAMARAGGGAVAATGLALIMLG